MNTYNYYTKALEYLLPYLRTSKDIRIFLKVLSTRYELLQSCLQYLLNGLSIKKSRGIWLDYIGKEIGTTRDETDFSNYFCVNQLHINVPKQFYFMNTGNDPTSLLSLEDSEFIQKITAHISANNSCGTYDEIVDNITKLTNQKDLVIEKDSSQNISVRFNSPKVTFNSNTKTNITKILGNSIKLKEITRHAN